MIATPLVCPLYYWSIGDQRKGQGYHTEFLADSAKHHHRRVHSVRLISVCVSRLSIHPLALVFTTPGVRWLLVAFNRFFRFFYVSLIMSNQNVAFHGGN
jgi:hypothetical protein